MGEKSAMDIIAFDGVLTAKEAKVSNSNIVAYDNIIQIKNPSVYI